MADKTDAALPAPLYIFRAQGANRISHMNASSITEAFAKGAAPTVGAICVLVQDASDFSYIDDLDDDGLDDNDVVIALAVVRGIGGVASGTVRTTLSPIHRLSAPVPLGPLQESAQIGLLPNAFYSLQVKSETAPALIGHLSRHDPSVMIWLEQMFNEPRTFPAHVEQSRVEAKDAVQLSAQLAAIELPADAFLSPPTGTEDETLLQTLLNSAYELDLEEELLPLDLQRFDGELVGTQRAASVTVFTDRSKREKLLVMSVNKKPIELQLGVDLLYWDRIHDSFTFVQYKRLEKVTSNRPAGGSEWAYLRKGEIEKQLKLMPIGKSSPVTAADWRAFDTPFWFKFVRGDAGSKLDGKTLKGMHVPADWLRFAMKEDTFRSGPKGGFRVTYHNAKYLGRSAFTQLISRGFVGTAGARSEAFKKVLQASKDRELIIAVRDDWQKDEEPVGVTNDSGEADGARTDQRPPEFPF